MREGDSFVFIGEFYSSSSLASLIFNKDSTTALSSFINFWAVLVETAGLGSVKDFLGVGERLDWEVFASFTFLFRGGIVKSFEFKTVLLFY